MALLDQPPPKRLHIVEKGGRLVVIDRLTGTTPPTAAELMKAGDARSRSPADTPRSGPQTAKNPPASSLWTEARRKASPDNRAASLRAANAAQTNRQTMMAVPSQSPKARPEKKSEARKRNSLPLALLIFFLLIAAWDVLNGFAIAILILIGAAALLKDMGSLTSILSPPLGGDKNKAGPS